MITKLNMVICKYLHIHVHLSITVYTIANLPKIYQKITDISDELIQNLYIQLQKKKLYEDEHVCE